MDIAFFLVAFAGAFLAVYRSLGWGFLTVIAVGYFSGVIRANCLGVFTTFMFDAAVLALYLGFFFRKSLRARETVLGLAGLLVPFMIVWPTLLCLLPINYFLIQCVGLRAAIWFLPVLLIATRLTTADLAVLSRGLVVLNLVALAVGVYVYLYGVEALYPKNAVTNIIYGSQDVGGRIKYHRVPSSFLNAHAYGGTMLYTMPFLFNRLGGVKVRLLDRCSAAAGLVAAVGGLLMCGARSPMIQLGFTLAVALVLSRFSLKLGLVIALLLVVGLIVAGNDERLQRASSLQDTEMVGNRVTLSVNRGLLDLLINYPLGGGLGTAAGTSIPFFLAHLAPESIGAENEYSRILVEQGWFGLAGWLALLGWLYVRPPSARCRSPWWLGVLLMYSLTLACWLTAFIGTGILTAIPGTFLILTQMGVLIAVRNQGAVPEAVSSYTEAPAEVEAAADPDEVPVEDLGLPDPGALPGGHPGQAGRRLDPV